MSLFKIFKNPEDDFFRELRNVSLSHELLSAISIAAFDFMCIKIMAELVSPLVELLASQRSAQIMPSWSPEKPSPNALLMLRNEAALCLTSGSTIRAGIVLKGLSFIQLKLLPALVMDLVLAERNQVWSVAGTNKPSNVQYSSDHQTAYAQMMVAWMGILHTSDPFFRNLALHLDIPKKWLECNSILPGVIIGMNRTLEREPASCIIDIAKQVLKRMPTPQKTAVFKSVKATILDADLAEQDRRNRLAITSAQHHGYSDEGVPLFNNQGKQSGNVSYLDDGRAVITAGQKPDFLTATIALFSVVAGDLVPAQQDIFSRWAGLPSGQWTLTHRQLFASACIKMIQQRTILHKHLPPSLEDAAKHLENSYLPGLPRPLTPEIEHLMMSMFEV